MRDYKDVGYETQLWKDKHRNIKLNTLSDTNKIKAELKAMVPQVQAYAKSQGAVVARVMAGQVVDKTQGILRGEIGNHFLAYYYTIKGRKYPRYVGGRHIQTGTYLRSFHAVPITPTLYSVGTNADQGKKLHDIDVAEVGYGHLARGAYLGYKETGEWIKRNVSTK